MKVEGNAGAQAVGQNSGMSDQDLNIKVEDALEKHQIGQWMGTPLR